MADQTANDPRALTADEWNDRYPPGTEVWAYPGIRSDAAMRTVTSSRAWNVGSGTPVVAVSGYPRGGIALTHVDPVEPAHVGSARPVLSDEDVRRHAADLVRVAIDEAASRSDLWQAVSTQERITWQDQQRIADAMLDLAREVGRG